ncbi:zinc finger MYM-type protein 1-like [Clinocottus analis]|uniref:zinc finger MYM-type protein 1-like n=1 Tax=Clinocottus analis TaxID=304258 RepID=UPI0035C03526
METHNSVKSLLQYPFERRTLAEKLLVKHLGPDQPSDLNIKQQTGVNGKLHMRSFRKDWYTRKPWLAGCSHANAVFCFPCLLFKSTGTDSSWTDTGVRDMKHLSEKIKQHESTRTHMDNSVKLAILGKVNIAPQLDDAHKRAVKKHNEQVDRNRHVLSKIIDCLKFCGAFELAVRHETDSSDNDGVFRGLLDFAASLDGALEEHLETASGFHGTSEAVRDELLDCMLCVTRDHILEEAKNADFIAIQADEATDASPHCQLALVLRYIDAGGHAQERFFEHVAVRNATADSVAAALKQRLGAILPSGQTDKLIAQAYDGAAVMRGPTGGVQGKILDVYDYAQYVHSYAHRLDLVVQQATARVPGVHAFFSDLGGVSAFFSGSPERTAALDRAVAQRLPGAAATRWDFQGVNTVHAHKEDLLKCFQTIRDFGNFDPQTVREAAGFVRMLEDETFCFFLALFHQIMPHVDMLSTQLQRRNIDQVSIKALVKKFTDSILTIRTSISSPCEDQGFEQQPKRRRMLGPEEQRLATEVCDIILMQAEERFSFTQHLVSATLLHGELFPQHSAAFPESVLEATVEAYPMLNQAKLKTELSLIYENGEFRGCRGAVPLYQFFMENNLLSTLSETATLLRILITTPMTTAEPERCFSTSRRIRAFLRNAVPQERLNALAMLSVEKKLVRDMPGFNQKVIERFATRPDRRATFLYK